MTITYSTTLNLKPEYYNDYFQTIDSSEDIYDLLLENKLGNIVEVKSFVSDTNILKIFKLVHAGLVQSDVIKILNFYELNKQRAFLVYIKSVGNFVNCIFSSPPKVTLVNSVMRTIEVGLAEIPALI